MHKLLLYKIMLQMIMSNERNFLKMIITLNINDIMILFNRNTWQCNLFIIKINIRYYFKILIINSYYNFCLFSPVFKSYYRFQIVKQLFIQQIMLWCKMLVKCGDDDQAWIPLFLLSSVRCAECLGTGDFRRT